MKTMCMLQQHLLCPAAFPREKLALRLWKTLRKLSQDGGESLKAHGETIPPPISEEIVDVSS
jgi:hypothetical protein